MRVDQKDRVGGYNTKIINIFGHVEQSRDETYKHITYDKIFGDAELKHMLYMEVYAYFGGPSLRAGNNKHFEEVCLYPICLYRGSAVLYQDNKSLKLSKDRIIKL